MPRLASLIVASATFASLACAELQAAPAGMAVVLAATVATDCVMFKTSLPR